MSIEFKIAPTVVSASLPLASHMTGLAEAINTRLRSGLADCTKRIHQYTFNLFRQIRNPDVDGNFPSLGEFPMYYQQICFDQVPVTWPETEAGTEEGANLASPAAKFVFGDAGTPGEGDSFTAYDFYAPPAETTPETLWELGKEQRGAYDPNTGDQNAPMFDLSQRHFRLSFPDWSRHGKSPGGYLPTPQKAGSDCYQTSEDGSTRFWTNYIYKFKNITSDIIEYTGTGTCGPEYGGSENDIYYIADYPFAWYVYQFDGTIYRFDKSDYIMVNDGGGYPARENGDQIQRLMVNPFIADFRGTEAQRNQTCFDNNYIEYCFANQDFYTSQYQLAPSYGVTSGDVINAEYLNWTWNTNQSSGSTSTPVAVHSGFRIGGHLIKQSFLSSDVQMQMLQDGNVVHSFTIHKVSGSYVETFLNGPNSGNISYRFASTASFTSPSGYIYIEQSQLYDYKPEVWDGYALIRLSSAKGPIGESQMDTRGIDAEYSREIYNNYRAYGCFANSNGAISVEQQQYSINTNPVFDAMRKYLNSFTRTINGTDMRLTSRPMIVGYEVSASKSILYFNRFQAGLGLETDAVDSFYGLVNSTNSASNGITATASPTGYTNEWVMELCGKPYSPSESSLWKPEVYANYYPYINRCHFAAPRTEIGSGINSDLFKFLQENSDTTATDLRNDLLAPESLTAYNYDGGEGGRVLNRKEYDDPTDANGIIALNFYKSCQIYPKPYVIESVTVQSGNVVKVVFDSRFQYCSGSAPESISNDVSSWNFATVASEPYRTDENIVRLFLLKMYNDGNNPSATTGDNAVNSWIPFDPDNPFASIYPTFFFTKLIPKPYTNDGIENTGSLNVSGSIPRAYDLQLCETYIRAICEGFVDETLSTTDACNTDFSTDYDYTFTNLCNDAFGRQWISNITGSQRSDYPQTYGPLPDMQLNTQVFNQLSACVNKLTKVRLPLPYRILSRYKTYQDSITVTTSWPTPETYCTEEYDKGVALAVPIPEATTLVSTSDWADAMNSLNFNTTVAVGCGPAGSHTATATRVTAEVAFDAQDDLAWYACNDDLRGLASGSVSTAALFTRDTTTTKLVTAELTGDQSGCSDDADFFKEGALWWNDTATPETVEICTYHEGNVEIDPGQIGVSDLIFGSKFNPIEGVTPCNATPYNSKQIEIVNTRHMIIQVPTTS